MRFLHCADIHLDSPLRGLERYDGAPVEQVRGATRRAFENMVQCALREKVDFVVRVYEHYRDAVTRSSEAFGASPDEVAGTALLDVRRAGVFEQAGALIEGAHWRDPKDVASWAAEVPEGGNVVVYCVYGHEVGRATAMCLRAAGIDARFLRGESTAGRLRGVRCSRRAVNDEGEHPRVPDNRPHRSSMVDCSFIEIQSVTMFGATP